MSFAGIKIFESELCTEPKIQLSKDVFVSDEFRRNYNTQLEYMFGRKPAMYMISGKYLAHPEIIKALRQMEKGNEF